MATRCRRRCVGRDARVLGRRHLFDHRGRFGRAVDPAVAIGRMIHLVHVIGWVRYIAVGRRRSGCIVGRAKKRNRD
jgi:hypothetical protein